MLLNSVVILVALVIFSVLFIYYSHLEIYTLLLGARLGVQKVHRSFLRWRGREAGIAEPSTKQSFKERLREAFEQDLFFNHSLAILSMVLIIGLVAILPISQKLKLELLTVITSVVPYVWSYTRATNVGINGGILGSLFGLVLFSVLIGDPEWFLRHTPFLVLYFFLANMSGWLGGWVGAGQLREAVQVTLAKVRIGQAGSDIQSLAREARGVIHNYLARSYPAEPLKFEDRKPSLTVFDTPTDCMVISYRHEMEWRLIEKPQKIAKRWIYAKVVPPLNQIIDYMFNVLRSRVTKVIFLTKSEEENVESSDADCTTIYILILNYKETPSIVWVDQAVEEMSEGLKVAIQQALTSDTSGIHNPDLDLGVESVQQFAYRQWRENVTLEQYSKFTHGSRYPYDAIRTNQIGYSRDLPSFVQEEIEKSPTFFDQFRGSMVTFVGFLFAQVLVAIFINIVSEGLAFGL